MAQIFFSENPREREQLKGGIGVSDRDSFDYGAVSILVQATLTSGLTCFVGDCNLRFQPYVRLTSPPQAYHFLQALR
jgi:hypothetical protein